MKNLISTLKNKAMAVGLAGVLIFTEGCLPGYVIIPAPINPKREYKAKPQAPTDNRILIVDSAYDTQSRNISEDYKTR